MISAVAIVINLYVHNKLLIWQNIPFCLETKMGEYLFRLLLILTIPAIAIPTEVPTPIIQLLEIPNLKIKWDAGLISYDEILHLIELIENEDIENLCNPEQIEEIVQFVTMLAEKGTDPNEPIKTAWLQEDIYTLQNEIKSPHYFVEFDSWELYSIKPAIYLNQGHIEFCKNRSWLSEKCHNIGKFVRKHKKEIIIGAAVVVAAIVITVVVVSVAGASAGSSVVAAAGATASVVANQELDDKPPAYSTVPIQSNTSEISDDIATALQSEPIQIPSPIPQMVSENAEEIKATFIQNISNSSDSISEKSLKEKAKELGSIIAHQTLDAVGELIEPIPQFLSQIQEISSYALSNIPDNPTILTSKDPLELHQERVTSLHNTIDELFDTDYASSYTPEAKALSAENVFEIGVLAPPTGNGFSGKRGWELKNPLFQARQNKAITIEGRVYKGHAIDQMRNRGIPPSVVENTIKNGELVNVNQVNGTFEYFDNTNKIKVILNEQKEVVTAIIIE
jgi:hypothetical protein